MKHLKIFEDFNQDDWQDRYDQLIRDMEEEAEPQGGPIADQYGSDLQALEDEKEQAIAVDTIVDGGKNLIDQDQTSSINHMYSKLKPFLNHAQIGNLVDHLDSGKDEFFINTRLGFYGVGEEDQDTVTALLTTLNKLYD